MTATLPFVGRKTELDTLTSVMDYHKTSLVVIQGRRRVGKSRLAKEFAKDKVYLPFLGTAPLAHTTAQSQRDHFSEQCSKLFGVSVPSFTSWFKAFYALSDYIKSFAPEKRLVILFDEISWMGSLDPDFIGIFKTWWDGWDALEEPHPDFMLILCGSVSTWIEEHIIMSSALFGRINKQIELSDLPLPEANQLLALKGFKGGVMEILRILSVTGGVPWYIDHIEGHMSAQDNIKQLCFLAKGDFVEEYNRIFHDLFYDKGTIYKKILDRLCTGMCDLSTLRTDLRNLDDGSGREPDDLLNQYLKNLIVAGFVTEYCTWSFKTRKIKEQGIYRLTDNYMRFYLKYMEPNLKQIKLNRYLSVSQLPNWEGIMGLQVETLLIKNQDALIQSLGLNLKVVAASPYIQTPKGENKGCQIDYLIQAHATNLYVCEFKFSQNVLGMEIVTAMNDKIARFSPCVPQGFGILPVLVHASGVHPSVIDSNYFYRIINVSEFL